MTATAQTFDTLRLDGVSRRFGGQDALVGLDLTIESGEFIALLGPSGCGKSTALNCVAGLLPLTAGAIWADDRRVDTVLPERRGFGMVFQNYALFPHMSVRANIAFGLKMRKLGKEEVRSRTEEAIRLVSLEDHADKLPGQLSGGQQQRVAIARAVVLEPALVLMDEPLSNLDAKLRLGMRTEIKRLHQTLGLTTIYVTHDQEEALSLADRLVVLRDGRVQQIGTPEELHTHPQTWHVADFMGYRNLLRLQSSAGKAGEAVTVHGDGLRLTGTAVDAVTEGAEVMAAVRPEDVEVLDGAGADRGVLTADVEVVEYQGREFAVEARAAGDVRLHVRTDRRLVPGDTIQLGIAPDRLLVFSATGARHAESEQPTAADERAEAGVPG